MKIFKYAFAFVMLLPIGCMKDLKDGLDRFEYSLHGMDYDKVKKERKIIANQRLQATKGKIFKNFDIKGIKINRGLESIPVFLNSNPQYKTKKSFSIKGKWTTIKYYPSYGEAMKLGTVNVSGNDRLFYIYRTQDYSYSPVGPLTKNLISALFKKYGPPRIRFYNNGDYLKESSHSIAEYFWDFDDNGNILPEIDTTSSEASHYIKTNELIRSPLRLDYDQSKKGIQRIFIPNCTNKNCKYKLSVKISSFENDDKKNEVSAYSISLADMSVYNQARIKYFRDKEIDQKNLNKAQEKLEIDL